MCPLIGILGAPTFPMLLGFRLYRCLGTHFCAERALASGTFSTVEAAQHGPVGTRDRHPCRRIPELSPIGPWESWWSLTWGALSGCTIGCRPRGSSAKLQCFSLNADITGCPESQWRCSLLKSQTWFVTRAMLQPLGLPLCLPSHFLSSIGLTPFSIRNFLKEIPPPQGDPCCSPPASPSHQYSFLTI